MDRQSTFRRVNTYTYDSANRLTMVNSPSSVVEYSYNGLGDRLTQNNVHYTLDLNAGLTQVLDDGTNTYLYGNGRISQTGNSTEYFLGDALGSVRQLTNEAAEVTLTKAYEPYGEEAWSYGAGQTAYGFAAEWTDANGLIHLRARYYAPEQGRFFQQDSWDGDPYSPATLNPYEYGLNNPVLYTDPSGYCVGIAAGADTLVCMILGGAVAGFALGIAAGGIFGLATYHEALIGNCGCEMQQNAIEAGSIGYYAGSLAITGGLIGGVAGAVAAAAPVLAFIVGAGGILVSTADVIKTYNIIKYETGRITSCTLLRALFDLAGILGGGLVIKGVINSFRTGGSWLKWSNAKSTISANSRGTPYPDVNVRGYGKILFPEGPYTPNNTALRSSFTNSYKGQFKAWWIKNGRLWPTGSVEIHHIKPLQFGGTNAFENLVPLSPPTHLRFTLWWKFFTP